MLAGIQAGVIAASATAGVLVGFAIGRGMPARPFNIAGTVALGARAEDVWNFHPLVTASGVIVHLLWALALGVLFALIAGELRGLRLLTAGLAFAFVLYLLAPLVAPPHLRAGVFALATTVQVIAVYVALAVSLIAGMRLALITPRGSAPPSAVRRTSQ